MTALGLGFGIALLLQTTIGLLRGWSVVFLLTRVGLQWLGNVFSHLLKLPLDFFEKRHLGDVTSRIGSVQSIQRTLTTSFIEALMDGLMAVVTLMMMSCTAGSSRLITSRAVLIYLGLRAVAFVPLREGTERQLMRRGEPADAPARDDARHPAIKVAGPRVERRSRLLEPGGRDDQRDMAGRS